MLDMTACCIPPLNVTTLSTTPTNVPGVRCGSSNNRYRRFRARGAYDEGAPSSIRRQVSHRRYRRSRRRSRSRSRSRSTSTSSNLYMNIYEGKIHAFKGIN